MPCSVTSQNDLPDYLKSIIKEIDIGNDDELKDCLCDLRTYVDTNSKRYTIPYCVYNAVDDQELYNEVLGANLTLIPVVDPQKLMELYFKYKSFDINLSADNGIKVGCEEAGDDNPNGKEWNETVIATKLNLGEDEKKARLKQVCNNVPAFGGSTNELTRDCEEDPTDLPAGGAYVPGYSYLLFFMQPYKEPDCGQPGPVLYVVNLTEEPVRSFNGINLNVQSIVEVGAVSNPTTWTT